MQVQYAHISSNTVEANIRIDVESQFLKLGNYFISYFACFIASSNLRVHCTLLYLYVVITLYSVQKAKCYELQDSIQKIAICQFQDADEID